MYNHFKIALIPVLGYSLLLTGSVRCFAAGEGDHKQEKLRDPTTPLGYKKVALSQRPLVLQAVFRSAGRVEAIVNGKSVSAGGVVDGATIVAVHEKSVTFRRNGETRVLQLRPSIMKRIR